MDNLVQMPDRSATGKSAADKMAARSQEQRRAAAKVSEAADGVSGAAGAPGTMPGSVFSELQERIGMGRAVAVDGFAFHEIREALGFSQRDLERVSGVGRSSISDYETEGAATPEMERTMLLGLRRLAYERHRDTLLALAVMEKAVNG